MKIHVSAALLMSVMIITQSGAQTNAPLRLLSLDTLGGTNQQQTPTSTNPETPVTGHEVWLVSGTNYHVQGTALLTMANGQTLFVIKALCDFAPGKAHRPLALSLARYAVDHGYLKKVKQSWWNGVPQVSSGAVGVALMQELPGASAPPTSGYRYNFSAAELGGRPNHNGEGIGARTASQPIRSQTNRTSPAPASGR